MQHEILCVESMSFISLTGSLFISKIQLLEENNYDVLYCQEFIRQLYLKDYRWGGRVCPAVAEQGYTKYRLRRD